MEQEEEGSAGFDKTGTLVVATDAEVERFIKTGIALSRAEGYQGEYITDKARIKEILPDLDVENILGAGWTPDDGYFDATMASNTFAKKIKANGGEVLTFTKVENIKVSNKKVTGVETNKGSYNFDVVVDASGPWTRYTSRMVGV